MARAKELPEIDPAALDALIEDAKSPENFIGLMRAIQKRLAERMLAGELTVQLGYAPGEAKPDRQANHRKGTTPKTVLTDTGAVPLEIPRERDGSFRPQLVRTGIRRLPQFDANVLSLYARGSRSYPPHASLSSVKARPGEVLTIDATHIDWLRRPYRSVPNACVIPLP